MVLTQQGWVGEKAAGRSIACCCIANILHAMQQNDLAKNPTARSIQHVQGLGHDLLCSTGTPSSCSNSKAMYCLWLGCKQCVVYDICGLRLYMIATYLIGLLLRACAEAARQHGARRGPRQQLLQQLQQLVAVR